jgi:hypothetical protein
MDNKLIDICTKKINKEINDSWTDIAIKYNVYEGNGENLRCAYNKWRKKNGQLKSVNEIKDIGLENKLDELELKNIELQKTKNFRLFTGAVSFNRLRFLAFIF